MEKIKQIWSKMDISTKLILPLQISMLVFLLLSLNKNISSVKIEIAIALIAFTIIYRILKWKHDEFSEEERKCLYDRRKMDIFYFILYMMHLESNLILLVMCFEPAWLGNVIASIVIVFVSWVLTKYTTLIYHISKEFKLKKGE